MITQKQLQEYINYDIDTGEFSWIKKPAKRISVGKIMSSCTRNGYYILGIQNKTYYLHRLAWLYVNGEYPRNIDHINHNKLDNRISNLRDVTKSINQKNMSKFSNNTTGITGVSKCNKSSSYICKTTHNGNTTIKRAKTIEEAKILILEMRSSLSFHENHGC